MKRLMLVWVMILCMMPLGGWAEETVIKGIDKDEIWSDYNGDEDAFRILAKRISNNIDDFLEDKL